MPEEPLLGPLEIETRSLVVQVAEGIQRQILRGRIRPGTPLRESRIARDLQVSRNTVREAIRALVPTGLVRYDTHRGFRVAEIGLGEIRDIYAARAVIEGAACRAGAARGKERLAAFRQALDGMREASARGDSATVHEWDMTFHLELVSLLDNRWLREAVRRGFLELRVMLLQVELGREQLATFAESHEPLLEALAAGDGERLHRALKGHLDSALAYWTSRVERD